VGNRRVKQALLVAEALVEAGAGQAGRGGQVVDRGGGIAMAPKTSIADAITADSSYCGLPLTRSPGAEAGS